MSAAPAPVLYMSCIANISRCLQFTIVTSSQCKACLDFLVRSQQFLYLPYDYKLIYEIETRINTLGAHVLFNMPAVDIFFR